MKRVTELFDLGGRVAILTGGAGLLGREYALALSQAGARVVIADTDIESGLKVAREVQQECGAAIFIETDVSSKSSVESMVAQTLKQWQRIDILINNAALDPKFDPVNASTHIGSFEDYPLELWNKSVAVNLTGMFLCAQAVAKPMLASCRGVIVNISSIYGLVGPDQRIYQKANVHERACKPVTYSVTKSATLGLTRYLATYWAGQNIRVNTLTPGGVFNGHDDEFTQRYSQRTPIGRMARSSEYCGALLFLVSDASSYMTGANLV